MMEEGPFTFSLDSEELYTYMIHNNIDFSTTGIETMSPDSVNVGEQTQPIVIPELKPIQSRGPPERSTVDTAYNFRVEVNSSDTNKKKYLYSHLLNRIYVDMECDFSVLFNWDERLSTTMCVRACVVFQDEAQAEKRVERCLHHLHQGANAGMAEYIGKNVLHSSREIGTAGLAYCGEGAAPDSWLSTVVTLCKTGTEPVAHAYKFVCKSSCAGGINRRAIAIIFTLEDAQGAVYGRQLVGARVCACPRRDMQKDEEANGAAKAKKRVSANSTPAALAQVKKIKIEVAETDDRVLTLPPLEVVGKRAVIAGLEVILTVMQEAQEHRRGDPQAVTLYEARVNALKRTIRDLKNKPPTAN